MFGLCDCNNFYVSAERVFRPDLENHPVVVLSNNDGCVVSRSNEAKKLGIKMAVPLFQIQELVKKHHIVVFSSNYELYADMSNRVMTTLSEFSPDTEIYSIDEMFIGLTGFEHWNLKEYGTKIVETVLRNTGIPTCLGIAPTKTLAKLANHFAKKFSGYRRVCLIDTSEKIEKSLKLTEISDVWGIGYQLSEKLKKQGVSTAYDFTQLPKSWVRKHMTVVGERTWRELQGESCISLETVQPDKKQIITSRSFGLPITKLADMSAAIAGYAGQCAYKLRGQNSAAVSLMVYVTTNFFKKELPQYYNSKLVKLPVPTSSTIEIVKFAHLGLEQIFRTGYSYKKAGVIITEIVDNTSIQGNIFYQIDTQKHNRLMKAVDGLNNTYGRDKVRIAATGCGKYEMRRNMLSPRYTTKLDEIIHVKAT